MALKLQTLPREEAHFCLHTCQFLEEINIDLKNKKILVAYSAGLDSSAVLALFCLLKEKYNLHVEALHIHHSIRIESDKEAMHAQEICAQLGIKYHIIQEDIPSLAKEWKKGIEETARIVRYRNFAQLLEQENFDFVALGHHLNDLAEDSLMRQIRGTSLEESFGMQAQDPARKIVRPFLCTEKARLQQFVEACSIAWVEDSSNNSMDYMRNRIRHELLPRIVQENPNYLQNIANNWRQGQYDKAYWQEKLNAFTNDKEFTILDNELSLDRALFCKENKAFRLRILAHILRLFDSMPESKLLFSIDALALANESRKEISANNNLIIKIEREVIRFTKAG